MSLEDISDSSDSQIGQVDGADDVDSEDEPSAPKKMKKTWESCLVPYQREMASVPFDERPPGVFGNMATVATADIRPHHMVGLPKSYFMW